MKLEFMTSNDGEIFIWTEKGEQSLLSNRDDIVKKMYQYIKENYGDAMKQLDKLYEEKKPCMSKYRYAVTSRFLRCNCGIYDRLSYDWDNGMMHMEIVPCPLRGECKYEGVICRPVKNGILTDGQLKVVRLLAKGYTYRSIADILKIKEGTVKKHIANIRKLLEATTIAEIINYIDK